MRCLRPPGGSTSLQAQLFVGDATRDRIMELSSGYVGIIRSLLVELGKEIRQARHRPDDLQQLLAQCTQHGMGLGDMLFRHLFSTGRIYNSLSHTRAFLKFRDIDSTTQTLFELMLPLVRSANQPVSVADLDAPAADLVYWLGQQGVLSVTHEVDGSTWYALHTKLHLYFYRIQLQRCRPGPSPQRPSSLETALLVAVQRMSASRLKTSLLKSVHDLVEEEKLQSEISIALSSALPSSWNVCPEVSGRHVGTESTKRLDFMIMPPRWAVELLRDGDDLAEHEARFKQGGDYAGFNFSQYAVIDFRSYPYSKPRLCKDEPNTYFVLFENEQYTVATLVHASTGRTWELTLAP